MSVFDKVKQQFLAMIENQANFGGWVEWVVSGSTPATTNEEKITNVISNTTQHCARCLNLNGCQFLKSKMPDIPLHINCRCKVKDIPPPAAEAECDIRKFNSYIFHDDINKNQGKKALFESWGYGIMDSELLQEEFIRQAHEKYVNGNYRLGKLSGYGQHIEIIINLPRKNNGNLVSFVSVWMVYPYGKIQLVTPYGEK